MCIQFPSHTVAKPRSVRTEPFTSSASICVDVSEAVKFPSDTGAMPKNVKPEPRPKNLGEQARHLRSTADRLLALRRTTTATQILLARTLTLQVLGFLADR